MIPMYLRALIPVAGRASRRHRSCLRRPPAARSRISSLQDKPAQKQVPSWGALQGSARRPVRPVGIRLFLRTVQTDVAGFQHARQLLERLRSAGTGVLADVRMIPLLQDEELLHLGEDADPA